MARPDEYYNPAPYADELPGVSEDLPATGRTQNYQAFLDYVKSLSDQFTSGQEAQDPSMPVISRGVRDVPAEPSIEPPPDIRTTTPAGPPLSRRAPPDTYGWAYAPPGHLPGEPAVPIPDMPPGSDMPANERFRLPSGVVGYRQTMGEHDRLAKIEQQAQQARAARDQAARDAQMYNQMMQVAKSTKDIEIARKSIDVMGLQHDIQNGIPIHDAIARHPMAFGTGFGANLKAAAPPGQATWVAPAGGAPGHFQLPGGGVSVPPASVMDTEGMKPELTVAKDPRTGEPFGLFSRRGKNSWQLVPDAKTKALTVSDQIRKYTAMQKGLAMELDTPEALVGLHDEKDPKHQYYKDRQAQLFGLTQQIGQIGETASEPAGGSGATGVINPMPTDKLLLVSGQIYDTPKGAAQWDGKKFKIVQTR